VDHQLRGDVVAEFFDIVMDLVYPVRIKAIGLLKWGFYYMGDQCDGLRLVRAKRYTTHPPTSKNQGAQMGTVHHSSAWVRPLP
jgi:hypothetical protein